MRDQLVTSRGPAFRACRSTTKALGMLAMLLSLNGCDNLIEVEAPSRVLADDLGDPSSAALLVNSAGADFECALAHYVVAGGLVGNELEIGTTLIVMKEYDKRDFNPTSSVYTTATCSADFSVGVYKPLSTARWQADNVVKLLEGWTDTEVPNRTKLIATAAAYSGYSQVLLGEAMCTAALDIGPELQPADLFQLAVTTFDKATAAAQTVGDANLLSWARVGRARALNRLERSAEAANDARLVPAGFVMNATYSTETPRRENAIWDRNQRDQSFTVDPSYRSLTFQGVPDPRVDVVDTGRPASDGETPLWHAQKYSGASSPIQLATWEEAQLIVAEAELVAGNLQAAVDIINNLHSKVGLADFSSTDATEIRNQIIEERKREFFLEGHHLGDVRQYGIPLTPAPGVPFKDGGGVYLAQTCFPLPDVERLNNPNIGGG